MGLGIKELVLNDKDSVPSTKMTEVNLRQSLNALKPMLVTLLPMVIEVKPLQPLNASSPIVVTLLPIMTDDNIIHP